MVLWSAADPAQATQDFVVQLDRDAILRSRRSMVRLYWLSAAIDLAFTGALAAIAITQAFPVAAMAIAMALVILGHGGYRLDRLRRERRAWEAYELPAVAMRMSPTGLTLNTDRTPRSVFLPWHTVMGFSVHSKGFTERGKSLVVYLAPGVDASTPGTAGLDQPEATPMLRPRVGRPGFRYAAGALQPRVPVIDQALAHYTNGRLRIRPLV